MGSSRSPLPTPPPSTTATQRSLSRSAEHSHHHHHREGSSDLREHAEDARGRKHKRFTFANVSNALLDVVMDRVRSRSRSSFGDGLGGDATPPRGRTRERTIDEDVFDNDEEGTPVRERERSTLGRVSEVLGLDGEDGKEWGDGWKEFKKGEYTHVTFNTPHAHLRRHIYLADLVRYPRDIAAYAALRFRPCHLEAEGVRAPAWHVHDEDVCVAGYHRRGMSVGGRPGGDGQHYR